MQDIALLTLQGTELCSILKSFKKRNHKVKEETGFQKLKDCAQIIVKKRASKSEHRGYHKLHPVNIRRVSNVSFPCLSD